MPECNLNDLPGAWPGALRWAVGTGPTSNVDSNDVDDDDGIPLVTTPAPVPRGGVAATFGLRVRGWHATPAPPTAGARSVPRITEPTADADVERLAGCLRAGVLACGSGRQGPLGWAGWCCSAVCRRPGVSGGRWHRSWGTGWHRASANGAGRATRMPATHRSSRWIRVR
jgi:hypothetical protein